MALTYYWKLEYRDGGSFAQFDKDGVEQKWGQANLSQVKAFSWLPFDKALVDKIAVIYGQGYAKATENKPFSLEVKPGEEIIAFRRNYINSAGQHAVVYCMGTSNRTVVGISESGVLLDSIP